MVLVLVFTHEKKMSDSDKGTIQFIIDSQPLLEENEEQNIQTTTNRKKIKNKKLKDESSLKKQAYLLRNRLNKLTNKKIDIDSQNYALNSSSENTFIFHTPADCKEREKSPITENKELNLASASTSTSPSILNDQFNLITDSEKLKKRKNSMDFNKKRKSERQFSEDNKKFKSGSIDFSPFTQLENQIEEKSSNANSSSSSSTQLENQYQSEDEFMFGKPTKLTNSVVFSWKKDINTYIYDIRQAAYILKDWLLSFENIETFENIPRAVIDKVIREDQINCKEILENSTNEQIVFLKTLYKNVLNFVRQDFVNEKLNNWMKSHICFQNVAKCFNSESVNILEEISYINMPDIEMLITELSLPKTLNDCLKSDDIEIIRKTTLKICQEKKNSGCDCCVKRYIMKELENHKDNLYKFTFDEVFKSNQLWESDLNIPRGGLLISDTKHYDSEKEKKSLVESISNLGVTSDMIREVEEEKKLKNTKPKCNKKK